MKLTALLLFTAFLHVSANGYSQNVTLSVKDAPLQKVVHEIEKQTGFSFIYGKTLIDKSPSVTIDVKDQPLENVLEIVFRNQPLAFAVSEKFIVLSPKQTKHATNIDSLPSLNGELHGQVKNKQGEPLVNAYVIVKRTKAGIATNANGEFTLRDVRPGDLLNISFVGYNPLSVRIADMSSLHLVLEVTDNALDQVVIQGYGTTSQRLTTGDYATVTAAEIEKQPVMNPLMALQGRVAGLDIQQTSGYASGPIVATIRGLTSVNGQPTDPLYVIDGVPLTVVQVGPTQTNGQVGYSAGFLQNTGLQGPANGQSPLFSIDPANIESITVLKDADATSIYGSRGANGVILITTKKGKPGRTQFNIHVDEGVNKVTRYWDLLNTQQYLAMRREAFKNDGIAPNVGNAPDLLVWDTTRYTNWQKVLFGKAGNIMNAQMTLSGGDVHTTFRIGASYTHSTGITSTGADQRAAISFNLNHHSSDQRFTLILSSTYSFTQSDLISLPSTFTLAPDAPSVYDSTGKNLNWVQWDEANGGPGGNPFGVLLQPYIAKTDFLNSSLSLNYQLIRGLNISTRFGYNMAQADQISLQTIASQDPASNPTGTSLFGNNSNKNWSIEPQITYDALLGPGKFSVLVGGSLQENATDGIYFYGQGYTSDALLRTISNAPSQGSADNYGEYKYASIFGRLSYNVNNKYLFNLNGRRDGSSNYGPGNQFGNFASASAGWIFTDESWFKKNLRVLSFGKLRGSYGTAGSDGGVPYAYLTRWSSNNLLAYNNIQPLVATQHANPDYEWQQNRKLEVGLDLGFFKDWFTIRASYYRNRTNNQLLEYPTPYLSGFTQVLENLPALVQNRGWEFTFGGKGVHTKYFSWAPNFNLSFNQNQFLSFPGLGSSPFRNQGLIGQPLNGVYVLHFAGVDPQTGQYTYQDRNHDGVINNNYVPPTGGDVYYKKLSLTLATGFGFNFDLKGFSLALFFNVKKQTGINATAQGVSPGVFGVNYGNQPVAVLARWQKPGDISSVGKFSTNGAQDPYGFLGSSDLGYTDASYIRLQNVSLAYNLPFSYTKKAGLQSMQLFIHANNIFTITGYKGIDPEIQSIHSLPPTRTIVGGLSINF